jgi:hypothetical protein
MGCCKGWLGNVRHSNLCVSSYWAGEHIVYRIFNACIICRLKDRKHIELQNTQTSVNERDCVKRELVNFVIRHTRPVAPEQISRASRTTTSVTPLAMSSFAAKTPVIPEPMMMTEARVGRSAVVRWRTSGLG